MAQGDLSASDSHWGHHPEQQSTASDHDTHSSQPPPSYRVSAERISGSQISRVPVTRRSRYGTSLCGRIGSYISSLFAHTRHSDDLSSKGNFTCSTPTAGYQRGLHRKRVWPKGTQATAPYPEAGIPSSVDSVAFNEKGCSSTTSHRTSSATGKGSRPTSTPPPSYTKPRTSHQEGSSDILLAQPYVCSVFNSMAEVLADEQRHVCATLL